MRIKAKPLKESPLARLRKKTRRGFRGYPAATVAFYGPTADFASKVAVGIVAADGADPDPLERIFSQEADVRFDPKIGEQILALLAAHGVRSVAMMDRIIGCPHEEGIDYPDGAVCPQCPYWAGRDRWIDKLVE